MPIHRLYTDFIRFLDKLEERARPWDAYTYNYLIPNSAFLLTYWEKVDISLSQIRERVERVRTRDYSHLLALLRGVDLESLVECTIERCRKVLQVSSPDVYLFVGFFSSDGFVIELLGRPVIGIGLERFRDFRNLSLILAHEYCHYCLKLMETTSAVSYGESIFSEGVSSLFSRQVYPEEPLYKHLFFTRSRLNSCIQTEFDTFRLLKEKPLPEIHSLLREGNERLGIPPRVGHYISYRLVQDFMRGYGIKDIPDLLKRQEIAENWNLFFIQRLNLKTRVRTRPSRIQP